jgi:hypothetical protein
MHENRDGKSELSSALGRRDFLKRGGALIGTGLLAGNALSSGCSAGLQGTDSGFSDVGIWYFLPSFFEYSLGPWQPELPTHPDLAELWRQTIDWFADNGLNFAVIQLGPYGGSSVPIGADRIRFGWGYHYVLDFKQFPEAKCFDDDFLKQNQDIVRSVTEHGKRRGVEIYTHHYNFLAPVPFVDAHPELTRLEYLKKGNYIDQKLQCWDIRKKLYYDLCWNKPLYREFLASCFEDYLAAFPASAGILVTPGERARCECIECIGERSSVAAAKAARYHDSPEKRKTLAGFVTLFDKTVKDAGYRPLVRSWISGINEEWIDVLPKGVTYVTKYSVFDLTDGGPDPGILPWIEAGHNIWLMKEITGNENAGPMVLTVPEIFDEIAVKTRELGVKGIMGVYNCEFGFQFKNRRVQYANELLFANACGSRRGSAAHVCERYYRKIFGDLGPEILRAVIAYGRVPFNMSRLIGTHEEGFTWEFPYYFAEFFGKQNGHPGTIGSALDPPPWLAREIVPLTAYVKYLKEHPWNEQFEDAVTGDGKHPVAFLEEISESARQGLESLETLADRIEPAAAPEMDLLLNSARLALATGRQWLYFFQARLYYAGALGPGSAVLRKNLAAEAVEHYQRGLDELRKQGAFLDKLVPWNVIDPELTISRYRNQLKRRETEELPSLVKELAPYLS